MGAGSSQTSSSESARELTAYERTAKREIELWNAKEPGQVAKLLGVGDKLIGKPLNWALHKTAADRVLNGVLALAMDASSWSVDDERVLQKYQAMGVDVAAIEDIRSHVSLQDMDRHAIALTKGYRWTAAGEGVVAGGVAAFGASTLNPAVAGGALTADAVAVTTMACRAAAHMAAVYGYRVESPADREHALKALTGATSVDLPAKQALFADINTVALMAARRKTWDELSKKRLVKGANEAAAHLFAKKLTKDKRVSSPFGGESPA